MVNAKTIAAAALAASVPQAYATLFLTAPVATTTCSAGKSCEVAWNDDGKAPALALLGPCNVGLYVGSVTQQIQLQALGSIDVSLASSAPFTPDATVGPNSGVYFLRFTSVNGKDASNNNYPYQGFSAKFTLTGMTGTFNSTVQGLISSTGSPQSTTSAGTGGASSASTTTAPRGGSTSSTTSARPSSTSNAAGERLGLRGDGKAMAIGLSLALVTSAVAAMMV